MSSDTRRQETFSREALPEMERVYRFALRLCGEPDMAEDLVQDTFLNAWRKWEHYTPGTRIRSWLFTICRNLFLRREQRTRRHDEIVTRAALEAPVPMARGHSVHDRARQEDPEGVFWAQVVDREILEAVDALPVEFREALILADLEELPYAEIAEILGVATGTVKSRVFRARRILQEELYDYAVEAGVIRGERTSPHGGPVGSPPRGTPPSSPQGAHP